jgi:excinuclease ABC subunit B
MTQFKLVSEYQPTGDQPAAIAQLTTAIRDGAKHQVLLGVTGSGKTFAMANVIAALGRPALVIAPNKTLAAQLFYEFRQLFPENAVQYFISYYDYYQPEAYIANTDTYIAKDSAINDDIDKMRHAATQSLLERRDTIIVASVSCIYGLGSPAAYSELVLQLKTGQSMRREHLLRKLVETQYTRNDVALTRGCFRVRGDVVHILPSHKRDEAVRVEFFGDEIESLALVDSLTGNTIRTINEIAIYPRSHYVTAQPHIEKIVRDIMTDLGTRLQELQSQNKLVEFQRLEQRTMHDVEALEHLGFCPGIENYSRYLNDIPPGHPPPTLLDYFPDDFLTFIDESHITIPQIAGMYRGDRARKQSLVDYGFRLPSALDNRPLNFEEFTARNNQIIHVSATPGEWELKQTGGEFVEQIIRPTGLLDPVIEIRKATGQVDDLYGELLGVVQRKSRALVTTLTKKMAEDLTKFYADMKIPIRYLHSDIDSLERIELLRDLRKGEFSVLVGINLLREGLDLPEVDLVAVLDADQEGFLRSTRSLIQVVGRAARNANGRVIFYADRETDSMRNCISETTRRRTKQLAHNTSHGITPRTVHKEIPDDIRKIYGLDDQNSQTSSDKPKAQTTRRSLTQIEKDIKSKEKEMHAAAGKLDFEQAAKLRDEVRDLRGLLMAMNDDQRELATQEN